MGASRLFVRGGGEHRDLYVISVNFGLIDSFRLKTPFSRCGWFICLLVCLYPALSLSGLRVGHIKG